MYMYSMYQRGGVGRSCNSLTDDDTSTLARFYRITLEGPSRGRSVMGYHEVVRTGKGAQSQDAEATFHAIIIHRRTVAPFRSIEAQL